MDLSAPHAGFVIASYAISGAVILSLIIATIAKLWARERKLSELKERRAGPGRPDDEQ